MVVKQDNISKNGSLMPRTVNQVGNSKENLLTQIENVGFFFQFKMSNKKVK